MPTLAALIFDPDRLRYAAEDEDSDGGLVLLSDADEKRLSLRFIEDVARKVRSDAAKMARGETRLDDWQRDTIETVQALYYALAAFGLGSMERLQSDPVARANAEADVRFALDRLERFARTVEAGIAVSRTEKAIAARAEMYVRYGSKLYEDGRRRRFSDPESPDVLPMLYERNVLGNSEHCRGCLEASARGWQPIGTLPPVGKRDCMANCKCRMVYRRELP